MNDEDKKASTDEVLHNLCWHVARMRVLSAMKDAALIAINDTPTTPDVSTCELIGNAEAALEREYWMGQHSALVLASFLRNEVKEAEATRLLDRSDAVDSETKKLAMTIVACVYRGVALAPSFTHPSELDDWLKQEKDKPTG